MSLPSAMSQKVTVPDRNFLSGVPDHGTRFNGIPSHPDYGANTTLSGTQLAANLFPPILHDEAESRHTHTQVGEIMRLDHAPSRALACFENGLLCA